MTRSIRAALMATALFLVGLPAIAGNHPMVASPKAERFQASYPVDQAMTLLAAAPPVNVGNPPIPWYAPNSSDIVGANGPTTIATASLAGLVAGSPVTVIAAVTGKQIVVIGYDVSSSIANSTVTFQDAAGTPNVYDGATFAANGEVIVQRSAIPVFITVVSAKLNIAITGTSDVVAGSITYYYQ